MVNMSKVNIIACVWDNNFYDSEPVVSNHIVKEKKHEDPGASFQFSRDTFAHYIDIPVLIGT